MSELEPKLDAPITKMIYDGQNASTILAKMAEKYYSKGYPPRVVYYHSLLIHAIRARRLDLVRACFGHDEYRPRYVRQHLGHRSLSPVWESILIGDEHVLDYLLTRGSDLTEQFDVSIRGQRFTASPLQAAIKAHDFELFLKLVEVQELCHPSVELYCLHDACVDASPDFMAKMLNDGKISLEANKLSPSGHTPLCIAARHHPDFIPLLLNAGSNPNIECRDGKTALNALCKAINRGKMLHSKPGSLTLVKLLLERGTRGSDSPESSALRELISRSNFLYDQNIANMSTIYGDLVRLVSERSCQESKDMALLDVVNYLYYILCGCLAHRTDPNRLATSISIQYRQMLFWLQKINLLRDGGAHFDPTCWRLIFGHLLKANRGNIILFTNQRFMDGYRSCLGIIRQVLRILPPPGSASEPSDVEEGLVELIVGQPDVYLCFLGIYMDYSTVYRSSVTIRRLLEALDGVEALNNKQQLIALLEHLLNNASTLKYIVKRSIIEQLRGTNLLKNVQELPLPKELRYYLVVDEEISLCS
ncbi:hypothetical protein LSH36_62g03003 [Paralvinella palmiformis]|uniref:SOCS box domain-containing protein n=1 Tax=Paralvinella palmiformis TaxID=53620 RepID=A0AAD9K4C0_9ANNE|nr:hypothetical protein LSH36_62g03003 [Paralvinella palmiformis]